MRIGLVTERMLRGFGVDLTVDQVASGLAGRGHDVTVYASVSDSTFKGDGYQLKMIPTPAYSFFPRYDLSAQRHLGFLNGEGMDVWLIQTFPFFSYLPRLKAPVVAVEYGVSSTEGFPIKIRANFAYLKLMQYHFYLRYARRISPISEFLRRELPRRLQRKAEVIHLGAEHYRRMATSETGAEASALRETLGVANDEILLLYVGRLASAHQPYKGTAELVEMYRDLKERDARLRLLMVGFGGDAEKAWLESQGILVMANAEAEMMPAIFTACDIYMTASRWEGFDLPLVEAQSFGKPVVALDIGAHPEVVAAGRSGILCAGMPAMAAAVLQLAGDAGQRSEMGNQALANAGRFTWDKTVEAYDRLIRGVV